MDKDYVATIRENIKLLMLMRGIPSENALATKSKVSQKTVNLLLASDTLPNPTAKVLSAISKTLDVLPWMLWIKDFPFDAIGMGKPLPGISHSGYRLLSVFELLPDDKRKAILDYTLFQINEAAPQQAKQIRDTRTHYKALPRPDNTYPTCSEDFDP